MGYKLRVLGMGLHLKRKDVPAKLLDVCEALERAGGETWLVGGCVRDLVLGLKPKDWDVEVYQLQPDLLYATLKDLGKCERVGKQFGVMKLWMKGIEIDVALPRTEKKVGLGHKGFEVTPDPFCSRQTAVLRRDFTINAMMFNPLKEVFCDFHGGLNDLEQRKLQHVSDAFVEDPLRPLRAMQFAARFKLALTRNTAELCKKLQSEAGTLPSSRVWQEWLKWAESDHPSYGLAALVDMGWLPIYAELQALVGCPQHQRWHPEGDVWTHTCLVVDQAAAIGAKHLLENKERVLLMFAALCHDLGKPIVTYTSSNGEVLAPKHGKKGRKPSQGFLCAISAPKHLVRKVLPLVEEHTIHFEKEPSLAQVSWLAYRLEPANIRVWEMLTHADASGCFPLPESRPALSWLTCAEHANIATKKPNPIITGKHLLDWGEHASPMMGKMLWRAYEAQLQGEFVDEKTACVWFEKYGIASGEK